MLHFQHEMREQDKSLFLQLIKLHTTIKDLRADMNGVEDFDSYDDLHSAASLWCEYRLTDHIGRFLGRT